MAGDRVSHRHNYLEKRTSLPGLNHNITFLSFCFTSFPVSPGLVRVEFVKVSLTLCTLCKVFSARLSYPTEYDGSTNPRDKKNLHLLRKSESGRV